MLLFLVEIALLGEASEWRSECPWFSFALLWTIPGPDSMHFYSSFFPFVLRHLPFSIKFLYFYIYIPKKNCFLKVEKMFSVSIQTNHWERENLEITPKIIVLFKIQCSKNFLGLTGPSIAFEIISKMFFVYHFSQVSLCKTMANVQRIFVFVLFWFGFASSMKRIVCIYNFVTVAFFYIGVQLFPKLMIIKIVLIRIYIKKVFFIRYRYKYIYTIYIYIYICIYMQIVIIIVFLRKSWIKKGKGQNA